MSYILNEMNSKNPRILFFFWLQFVFLALGATHYLSVYFFAVPVFISFLLVAPAVVKLHLKVDVVSAFYVVLILGFFWRNAYNDLIMSLESAKDLVLILYNFAMTKFFLQVKMGPKSKSAVVYVLVILVFFFGLGRFLGYSSLELSGIIFTTSSYHMITWFMAILITFMVLQRESVGLQLKIAVVLFLILNLLLGGRTGIIVSTFIATFVFAMSGQRFSRVFYISFASLVTILVYSLIDFLGDSFFKDIVQRGISLGPREIVWLCYYDYLSSETVVFGFNKSDLSHCLPDFFQRATLENSFYSLQALTGIFSFVLGAILVRRYIMVLADGLLSFVMLSALAFRIFTGEFVFITVFDWLYLVCLFQNGRFIRGYCEKNSMRS